MTHINPEENQPKIPQSPMYEALHAAEFSDDTPAEMLDPLHGASAEVKRVIANERRRRAAESTRDLLTILSLKETITEAEIDPVTKLPNRAVFDRVLQAVVKRDRLSERPSTVLTIADLNGLKRVNEAKLHASGDAYLAANASGVSATLRPTDRAFRIGGDELAIIRTGFDNPDALGTLDERVKVAVRDKVAELGFEPELYTGLSMGTRMIQPGESATSAYIASDTLLKADKAAFNATIPQAIRDQDPRII